MGEPLIRSLLTAVSAAPQDVPLRLHLAELLLERGDGAAATHHAAVALQHQPESEAGRALMARILAAPVPTPVPAPTTPPAAAPPEEDTAPPEEDTAPREQTGSPEQTVAPEVTVPTVPTVPPTGNAPAAGPTPPAAGGEPGFDWNRADQEFHGVVPPMFAAGDPDGPEPLAPEVEKATVRLADVAGMDHVKERLEAAFLAPMRDSRLRRLFGKSLRGGLLMYGPPGCGKTFVARAVAGEMGASFLSVTLADVLDMWLGNAEKNLKAIFDTARRRAPCVLFLDEIDAIGMKRLKMHGTAMRNTVTQLLTELDSIGASNEGVFLLAATNHPWDVDSALRRPGRLDRTLLVLPPDPPARAALLRRALTDRPVSGIDLPGLVQSTDGYSGADLAHLCETAAEKAIMESIRSGEVRMIEMRHFRAAIDEVGQSTGPWFEAARNVALFSNEGGTYDDLLDYLKARKMV